MGGMRSGPGAELVLSLDKMRRTIVSEIFISLISASAFLRGNCGRTPLSIVKTDRKYSSSKLALSISDVIMFHDMSVSGAIPLLVLNFQLTNL